MWGLESTRCARQPGLEDAAVAVFGFGQTSLMAEAREASSGMVDVALVPTDVASTLRNYTSLMAETETPSVDRCKTGSSSRGQGSPCSTSEGSHEGQVSLRVRDDSSKQFPLKGQQPPRPAAAPMQQQRWLSALGRIPSYWWVSLVLFLVLESLAMVGSVYYARSVQASSMAAATEVAKSSARALERLLEDQKAPILFLANMIELNPHWPSVNASFFNYSRSIYNNYPFYEIEACPYGYIGAMDFPWNNLTGQAQYQFKLDFDYQKDMLDPTRSDWALNIHTISVDDISMAGPWFGEGPLASGAFVLRYNIFLPASQAASWDMPPSNISTCPPSVCSRPGNLTWWGWANSVFVFSDIAAGLEALQAQDLLYSLAPSPSGIEGDTWEEPIIAISDPPPDKSTQICINVDGFGDNWWWPLCIGDSAGVNFWPAWFPGLAVGLSALCVLISVMVLLVLRSRAQAVRFWKQQLQTNKELAVAKEGAEEGQRKLEEEKKRMKDLMQRQHQLIALFGAAQPDTVVQAQSGTRPAVHSKSGSGSGARDRIEELRHSMTASNRLGSSSFELVLLELLGEGSFGKVYRGTWRGTEVAIKTMVLPAYMSGNEKREKMLIMETAISSALAHPNVVQTFTYSIDTLMENERPGSDSLAGQAGRHALPQATSGNCFVIGDRQAGTGALDVGGAAMISAVRGAAGVQSAQTMAGSALSVVREAAAAAGSALLAGPGAKGLAEATATTSRGVHGYEVRLVLEFCDRGCLHDALSQQAFMCPQGLNYKAILDTALDITRAMLHLHMADVLHGDLKARNVMLKSSGAEGRGLVAKIADFGLAVRIDTSQQTHMSNLFQGTLTHMAPELLLQGRMSKAADVYAFGVLLWELFTSGEPFRDIPQALLGHQVIHENKRPKWPLRPPADFQELVDQCWAADALQRPTFEAILPRLEAMRGAVAGPTPRLMPYKLAPPASLLRQHREQQQSQRDIVRLKGNQVLVPHGPHGGINAHLAGLGAIVIGDVSTADGGSFVSKQSRPGGSLQPVAECVQGEGEDGDDKV